MKSLYIALFLFLCTLLFVAVNLLSVQEILKKAAALAENMETFDIAKTNFSTFDTFWNEKRPFLLLTVNYDTYIRCQDAVTAMEGYLAAGSEPDFLHAKILFLKNVKILRRTEDFSLF